MPTYPLTMTTGPAEEKGLDLVLARVNQLRARERPPRAALTKPQYLQGLVDNLVAGYKRQYRDEFSKRVEAALNTRASGAQITQVAQILGVEE